MKALVTGGCGFIGSALVLRLLSDGWTVLNVDSMTYASDRRNLASVEEHAAYDHARIDITDRGRFAAIFSAFAPDVVFHLAAESHVDRSIDGPAVFLETNVMGTFAVLDAALVSTRKGRNVKVLHVSTDEVYGSLGPTGAFTEETPYAPNSPYSASKAASDMLVRAWNRTYDLPVYISNCSNNYGPRQHAEKLIPTVIRSALSSRAIPIYGHGTNVRDWLYVEDHVDAMLRIIELGRTGEKYNIGGGSEIDNLTMAQTLCGMLDKQAPRPQGGSYTEQITFVTDRPGHDLRYAVDGSRAAEELGWTASHTFVDALRKTVQWYLDDEARWNIAEQEGRRLGLAHKENTP